MTDMRVSGELLTYRRGGEFSYFKDRVIALRGDEQAGARLAQHGREMRSVLEEREKRAHAEAKANGIELRVAPNRTPGTGGDFAPPLWLNQAFATYPRPGRVLAALMPKFDLPQGVQSINKPRLTTGDDDSVTQDGVAVPSRSITDAAVSSPVVTIAGQGDFPLPMLEQSPAGAHLDWAIFKDLAGSYDHNLEVALITGTGQNGQFYGLLNVGGNTVTYTDASPTAAKMMPSFGQMAAAVGNNRKLPPEIWLMRTSRWAWIGTGEDSAGMPLAVPGHTPPPPQPYLFDDKHPTPVAPLLGWPIYPNDAITGTAGSQDSVIACRPSDTMLLESTQRTMVDFESQSGTLGVRLQLRGYVAALLGRYPSGIAVLSGTGMVVQTGF